MMTSKASNGERTPQEQADYFLSNISDRWPRCDDCGVAQRAPGGAAFGEGKTFCQACADALGSPGPCSEAA